MTLKTGTFSAPFSNDSEFFETVYDFATDTGAAGSYVMTAALAVKSMVKLLAVKVNTAPVGATSVLSVGTATTAAAFISAEAITSFALGAVVTPEVTGDTTGFVVCAAGDTLDLLIATADLTAGKLTFVWEVRKY